jgi:hypothetical protein
LDLDGVEIEIHPPGVACAPYPWLIKSGTLLLTARAGHLEGSGVGESANMTVEIANDEKQASALLGYCLRARATHYDDDGEQDFAGLVETIEVGPLVLTLEA